MSKIKFGFADEIIRFTRSQYCDGYAFRMSQVEKTRDDLHVKVCAVKTDTDTHLIYSIDSAGLSTKYYRLLTDQITALTGVKRENISLSYIHTHSAPASGILADMPVDTDYYAYMGEICGNMALRAIDRACECTVEFAVLPEKLINSVNRRNREDIIDRRIKAAVFRNTDGKICGVFAHASCHAVLQRDMHFSADWLCKLNELSSDEIPFMFFQGRCGDINPKWQKGEDIEEKTEILGNELAIPVKKFVENSSDGESLDGEIKSFYETVTLPMREFDDKEMLREKVKIYEEKYFSTPIDDVKKRFHLRDMQWFREMLERTEKGISNDVTVPLQVLRVDKLVFVFVPFELLTLTGNKLEKMLADKGYREECIYVCGYSNSIHAYLTPEEEFDFGGYEVDGAAKWYNVSGTCIETERKLLAWYKEKIERI
ncbi:MAG: hypothetical protein IJD88_07535 [Clostridia bacterium]|nr:hypothetical protein [Clostridia bacterium]